MRDDHSGLLGTHVCETGDRTNRHIVLRAREYAQHAALHAGDECFDSALIIHSTDRNNNKSDTCQVYRLSAKPSAIEPAASRLIAFLLDHRNGGRERVHVSDAFIRGATMEAPPGVLPCARHPLFLRGPSPTIAWEKHHDRPLTHVQSLPIDDTATAQLREVRCAVRIKAASEDVHSASLVAEAKANESSEGVVLSFTDWSSHTSGAPPPYR